VTAPIDVDDAILNFDPAAPLDRFRAAGLEAAALPAEAMLPHPVAWPTGAQPVPEPLLRPPAETDDLSRFHGYDALVVTWTATEASALAALLSPGHPTSTWYEYRHAVDEYEPLVTGRRAPFNDPDKAMERYFHSLGLYFPCRIGAARVLLFKSGLHLDYDGPAVPVRRLVCELARTVAPSLLITTGAGGGIGSQVKLGDVVIAGTVRFDCRTQFRAEPWARASYRTATLPDGTLAAMKPGLLGVNAARIPGARSVPQVFSSAGDAVVTTDFFAFDDSTDYFKLQGLGRACDMGDAMIGNALQQFLDIRWYSIRNASDPQIPNPDHNIEEARQRAADIYTKYGGLTTAASAIATWAVIHSAAADR
jgi:hypothetical protein